MNMVNVRKAHCSMNVAQAFMCFGCGKNIYNNSLDGQPEQQCLRLHVYIVCVVVKKKCCQCSFTQPAVTSTPTSSLTYCLCLLLSFVLLFQFYFIWSCAQEWQSNKLTYIHIYKYTDINITITFYLREQPLCILHHQVPLRCDLNIHRWV